MRLYYTGAAKHLSTQGSPTSSLGGYVSSTLVPNGVEGSILPSPSQADIVSGGDRVVLIALKNTSGALAENIKIYYTLEDVSLYDISIGVVLPAQDDCSDPIFELITKSKSLPVGIDFQKADSELNAIQIQSLVNEGYLGIWIKQTISEEGKSLFIDCDGLYKALLEPDSLEAKREFPFSLHIKYGEE